MKVINLNDELQFVQVSELSTLAMLLDIKVRHFTMGTCKGWLYVYADDGEFDQFKAIADQFNFLPYDPAQQGDTGGDI